jgi:hypothetical protein
MRQLKRATKACHQYSTDSESLFRTSLHAPASDPYATPWDEPARYWGHGHGPLWASRKAYRREKLLGTW